MKKIFIICFIISSISLFGQDYPGMDVNLLIGKELKIKEMTETTKQYGYSDFYKDTNLQIKYNCHQDYKSNYDCLFGKTFKLISHEKYNDLFSHEKFKFQIENSETGIIFYDYDPNPKYAPLFPFEVIGGINFPDGYYCKEIEESKDKFEDKTTYRSPTKNGINFIKVKRGNLANTYLSIQVTGSTVNVNGKGVTILFDNGKKILKPNQEIDCDVNKYGDGYIYSAFIPLDKIDIDMLKQGKLTDARLYIYDTTINGDILFEYFKCIIDK
jgi:hypothetical protein